MMTHTWQDIFELTRSEKLFILRWLFRERHVHRYCRGNPM